MSTMLVSGSEEDMLMIPVKRKGAAACDDGAGEKKSGILPALGCCFVHSGLECVAA